MKERPHILYVGQLWEGGTCLERMKILAGLSCKITPFDTTPWVAGNNRWKSTIAHRINFGAPVRELNSSLETFAQTVDGITHVWIDKGRWIYPETVLALRAKNNSLLVHYTPDPQLLLHRSRHFNACIPLYDLLVTTKPYEIELYKKRGAKEVMLVLQGYDERFAPCKPPSPFRRELESEVCFVGHYETHYAKYLCPAKSACKRLKIWGPNWSFYSSFHPWAKGCVAGNGIWGRNYPFALASSKIALGLLSKKVPETTTTRSFEIPAMGAFLLAERTEDHMKLFDEGQEAEFFSCKEELCEKIIFYLAHEQLRAKIARAGYERSFRSGYDCKSQLSQVLRRAVSQ